MLTVLRTLGWLACVVYSTIPSFWFMIHPFADRWRARRRSPYFVLLPAWIAMWGVVALATRPWRHLVLYANSWTWVLAAPLFAAGFFLYSRAGNGFSAKQLGGLPEVHGNHREQRLVTDGIRARVRHPVYLAHLCEMLAWSIGTGLAVCWALTVFAIVTGAMMIRMEDAELEKRFGGEFRKYRLAVPPVLPKTAMLFAVAMAVLVPAITIGVVVFAHSRKDQPMLFQHGTPEVPSNRAFAIMNPFRDRMPEAVAEVMVAHLRSSDCREIVRRLNSEERVCAVMHENVNSILIWREDKDSSSMLVYDLPDEGSRLWVSLIRREEGLVVDSVSVVR